MSNNETETTPAPPAPSRLKANPELITQLFERKTSVGLTTDKPLIERRKFEFQLDGSACAPGVFVDEDGEYFDVMVTLQSLSSAEEIEALTGVRDPNQAPYVLAKRSLLALNGHVLSADEREFFWEALGMGGRQLAFLAFGTIGSASGVALGKFRATFSPC
jgi:hypothetical protein